MTFNGERKIRVIVFISYAIEYVIIRCTLCFLGRSFSFFSEAKSAYGGVASGSICAASVGTQAKEDDKSTSQQETNLYFVSAKKKKIN